MDAYRDVQFIGDAISTSPRIVFLISQVSE